MGNSDFNHGVTVDSGQWVAMDTDGKVSEPKEDESVVEAYTSLMDYFNDEGLPLSYLRRQRHPVDLDRALVKYLTDANTYTAIDDSVFTRVNNKITVETGDRPLAFLLMNFCQSAYVKTWYVDIDCPRMTRRYTLDPHVIRFPLASGVQDEDYPEITWTFSIELAH